jgi:cell division ATPase FtsA
MHEARSGTHIDRVVLTGGSSLFHDFSSYAGYVLDREVVLGNPFTKVAYPAFMEDKLKEIGPIFATAVGAALRTFEL